MKRIYEFEMSKEQDVQEIETSTNDKGEEVKITKTVKKKVPQKFFLKKPNRPLYDDAELFFGVKISEGIRAGLLTANLLEKRFINDGGVLSDKERKTIQENYRDLSVAQIEYQKLSVKKDEEKTEEDKIKITELTKKISDLSFTARQFEKSQVSLYDQTAESRARIKLMLWWSLQLAYRDSGQAFFPGENFEEKLTRYDEIVEKEDFESEVARRFLYLAGFWQVSGTTKKEDFDTFLAGLDGAK